MAQMKYFYELTISSSPHAHSPVTTQTIMRDVLIALVPALLGSIYFFGFRALLVTLVSAAACVFFEWGFCKIRKLHCKTYDLSAVVTGVLLAFVCPVTIPYWTIILGDFFAIVLVKMLFGGLGKNIVNPALAGRAFLFSWPVLMSNWVKVGFDNAAGLLSTADAVTAATPMSAMHQGALPEESILDMFLGNIGGSLGEISALLLIVGGLYLIWRKVINWQTPAAYIATVAVLTFLFPKGGADNLQFMLYSIFGGGLMLGAFFMATDYTTSPVTKTGQLIFGLGCGLLTVFIRYFGSYPEGVCYSIMIMNLVVALIDKAVKPSRFGVVKSANKEAAAK